MPMVNARKNKVRIRVSRNAYEKYYRKLGYIITSVDGVDGMEEQKEEHSGFNAGEGESVEEPEQNKEEDELETIPISEMNKEQLAEYAERHGIDTSGCRNVREARQLIQRMRREAQEKEG